jgi:hypothetical protein
VSCDVYVESGALPAGMPASDELEAVFSGIFPNIGQSAAWAAPSKRHNENRPTTVNRTMFFIVSLLCGQHLDDARAIQFGERLPSHHSVW